MVGITDLHDVPITMLPALSSDLLQNVDEYFLPQQNNFLSAGSDENLYANF